MLKRREVLQSLALSALLCSTTGCYFTHLAFGQLDIAMSTISVEEALADPALDETAREKVRFIGEVKRFAEEHVGMAESKNYTVYLPGDPNAPVSWVVVAAEPLQMKLVTHWYPFVGTVSYKGFFDKEEADEEADELREDGYDVIVHPVAAYSTLGWFTDPITAQMLNRSEPDLAELILHELTHSEVYVADQTDFNESLGTFVGHEAALQFAAERWGADSKQVQWLHDSAADEAEFDAFVGDLKSRLLQLYRSPKPKPRKLADRDAIIEAAREDLRGRTFRVTNYAGWADRPINNAVLLAHATYHQTDLFAALYEKVGRAWPAFFGAVREASKSKDSFDALKRAVQED